MMYIYNLTDNQSKSQTATKPAAADLDMKMSLSDMASVSVQVVWAGLNATDATFKLYGSEDGTNWYLVPNANTIVANSSAGNNGWQTELFKGANLRVLYERNSVSAGTIKVLVTAKEPR